MVINMINVSQYAQFNLVDNLVLTHNFWIEPVNDTPGSYCKDRGHSEAPCCIVDRGLSLNKERIDHAVLQ